MEGGSASGTEMAVVFKPGYYYKKEKKDKVSNPTVNSKGKALVKPIYDSDSNMERTALDKPYEKMLCQDGKALVKPIEGGSAEGKRLIKGREKEAQERIQLLERQVEMERERVAQLEKACEAQQQALRIQQDEARREMGKLITETEEKLRIAEQKGQKEADEDEDMETVEGDVYEVDEGMIPAGPYYNVKASRMIALENEVMLGDGRGVKRKEAGFNLRGECRLSKVVWRHRLDDGCNITVSFNPANMRCSGCLVRGEHSVVGAEDGRPVVLVASDQNFPPVLFSKDNDPCVGILRIEYGTAKELGFAVGDMLHGISLPAGSVILVGSTSDLSRQGIGGYTDELARSLRVLKDKQGGKVKVIALPPVLLGGINSFRLLRLVVEVEHWAERLEGGGWCPPEENQGRGREHDRRAPGRRSQGPRGDCGDPAEGGRGVEKDEGKVCGLGEHAGEDEAALGGGGEECAGSPDGRAASELWCKGEWEPGLLQRGWGSADGV